MLTILIFILILGVLIFVHELGHFVTARRNGIRAEEFGFGFPPRVIGVVKDEGKNKWRAVWGNRVVHSENTVYSLNWIPIGGFVKIKGENGEGKNEPDSFASKSAFARIKVLGAGVVMNFFLAWVLLSLVLMIGAPQAIEPGTAGFKNSKIQISEVAGNSPAEEMGLRVGDEILKKQPHLMNKALGSVEAVQEYINANRGGEIILEIKRGNEILQFKGNPRKETPEGQGALGIALAETVIVDYPWYEALGEGLFRVVDLTLAILIAFGGMLKSLIIGNAGSIDVSGPVGIAVLTKQVASLGIVPLMQLTAILSINLGILNALPIPALDGGRILFILIEKIKRKPVTQKTEQLFHTIGFFILIALMIIVTFKDVAKFIN